MDQNDLCKVVSPKDSEFPMTNNDIYKIGDYKEPVYTEADNESHSGKIPCDIFCVTGKDQDL